VWAGVDSVWEQENAEARKMLENAAESHTSGARFVRRLLLCNTRRLKKDDILLGFLVMFQSNEVLAKQYGLSFQFLLIY
jgi:hypothetical protein